jgi:hypothetical protein
MPEAAVGVVGDQLEDFLLWLLLSRLRSDVYWLPTRFLSSTFRDRKRQPLRWFAFNLLNHVRHSGQRTIRNDRLDLTSASLSNQRLGQARWQLQRVELVAEGVASLFDESRLLSSAEDLVQVTTPRLYPVERQGNRTPAVISLDSDGWSLGPLPSPAPVSSADRSLGSKRWIVEYEVGAHVPPSRDLAYWMLEEGGVTRDAARITRSGHLAVFHPHIMTLGGATVDDTWNLRFRPPPTGVEIIRLLLDPGFDVDLMDKGRYYEELQRRVDFRELMGLINDDGFGELTAALLRRGSSIPTVWDGTVAAAEWNDVKVGIGTTAEDLIRSGLLHIVHATKCRNCRNVEHRRLAEIERNMRCRRCDSVMSVDALSADAFFRTQRVAMNGLLSEFLGQRSDAVMTAFEASGQSERMVLLPEIEVRTDSDAFNIDLVSVGRGELMLGEVKTGGKYLSNKDCRRYTLRMEGIAKAIAPVQLTVVHAWTTDLDAKSDRLKSPLFETRFISLPDRRWYSAR